MPDIHTSQISELFQTQNLQVIFRSDHPMQWRAGLDGFDYVPVLYSDDMIRYNHAYLDPVDAQFRDISVLIQEQNRIVAVWPLSLSSNADGAFQVTSQGAAILPPLLAPHLPKKSCTRLLGRCFDFLSALCATYGIATFHSLDLYRGLSDPGVSLWQNICAERGAHLAVEHCLMGDLNLTLSEYKSQIRKSYKSLITSGQKQWSIKIPSPGALDEPWVAFQALHAKAAGRITRTEKTWDIQKQLAEEEAAFLVYSQDDAGQMIGAAYFNISKDEAYYSIGAYDRALFDRPIAHVLQFTAIGEMMRRGLRCYRIGPYAYPWQTPEPTDKLLNISKFKSGFATHKALEVSILHKMPVSTATDHARP